VKSKIKSLSRNEQQTIIIFEIDSQIIKTIEKSFQKLESNFKLSNYKKKYGDKTLDNFWELDKKNKEFNFTLIAKKDFVRLKIKGDLDLISKFLKNIEKDTIFSKLSPKLKAKIQRRKDNLLNSLS